jgi:8-oxo-dGTP pyrophosphatase MutT (NUDIX family)
VILLTKMVPIAITILECQNRYLFLKRRNPPYEGLWSLIGGKIALGEHVRDAAIREVMEETGASSVEEYDYRGLVSERLIGSTGELLAHFLIFVGHASVHDFKENHREGDLALFRQDEMNSLSADFLPSDLEMFKQFLVKNRGPQMHEAELLHDGNRYHLIYYRAFVDEDRRD